MITALSIITTVIITISRITTIIITTSRITTIIISISKITIIIISRTTTMIITISKITTVIITISKITTVIITISRITTVIITISIITTEIITISIITTVIITISIITTVIITTSRITTIIITTSRITTIIISISKITEINTISIITTVITTTSTITTIIITISRITTIIIIFIIIITIIITTSKITTMIITISRITTVIITTSIITTVIIIFIIFIVIIIITIIITTCVPQPDIVWYKDALPINPVRLPRYRVLAGGSLQVNGLLPDDTGMFQCFARNEAGEVQTNTYLAVTSIAPNITAGPSDSTVIDGMSVILHCETSGAPRPAITWQKGERVLASGSVQLPRFTLLESGSLLISPAHILDAGTYTCMASNSRGIDEASADLVVWARTRITTPPQDQSVIKGTKATMACGVTHDPSVSVRGIPECLKLRDEEELLKSLRYDMVWIYSGPFGRCVVLVRPGDEQNHLSGVPPAPGFPEELEAAAETSVQSWQGFTAWMGLNSE
ncbi:hypothetical protein NFI96_010174 [Prochilodus magdalenae]|nr:hypothetical protein NFI96_010174 [Prochilodus magdalenae]